MAGSADARVEKTSPQRLLRSHLTLVLTLIPIVLSAMRFSAVANGDRATLVRQLSALDVKSTLLGTFVWLLPTAFGVRGGNVLDSLGVAPRGARTGRLNFWLAIVTTVMALVLSAFAPVNDLVNLLRCLLLISGGDLVGEVGGILVDEAEQGRAARVLPGQPQKVKGWDLGDTASVYYPPVPKRCWDVDPGVVGAVAGRPHHHADAM
jgi:hypothetical protein